MNLLAGFIVIAALAAIVVIGILLYCFYIGFYASRIKKPASGEELLPIGKIYEPYYDQMRIWMKETEEMPCREMEITSFDGLKLRGKFYQYSETAPIEIMFPGYRGDARRDLCGAAQRCFVLGHSLLLVDQRACGRSEGHVISFGVNESRDCEAWIKCAVDNFGPDVKIILTGISMGAATVLITAGKELPSNVVGVLADCGYSSAEEIIKKTIREMKLPPALVYPFVWLAGKWFGGFDLREAAPIEAVKKSNVPVLFAHGDADAFVPCSMSKEVFENCNAPKKLIIVPGADHCLCYIVDIEAYISKLRDFWNSVGVYE